MGRFLKLSVLALGFVVSSCCSPCRKAMNMSVEAFMDVEWKLIQWGTEALPGTEIKTYIVTFTKDGKITGRGDCNRFSGSYNFTVSGKTTKLDVGQLASTEMGCPNLAQENRYFEALKGAQRLSMDGDILILGSKGELVFERK